MAGRRRCAAGSQGVAAAQKPASDVRSLGWVYKLGARDGAPVWDREVVNELGAGGVSLVRDLAVDDCGRVYCAGTWSAASASSGGEGLVVRYGAGGGSRTLWRWAGDGTGDGNNCFTVSCAGGISPPQVRPAA